MSDKFTDAEIEALAAAGDGADIYRYGWATDLRAISNRTGDEYVVICMAKNAAGIGGRPYFGAYLTDKGKKIVNEVQQ